MGARGFPYGRHVVYSAVNDATYILHALIMLAALGSRVAWTSELQGNLDTWMGCAGSSLEHIGCGLGR